MRKKQDLIFKGVDKAGKLIVTANLGHLIMTCVEDTITYCNRKSRRAFPKLVKKLLK